MLNQHEKHSFCEIILKNKDSLQSLLTKKHSFKGLLMIVKYFTKDEKKELKEYINSFDLNELNTYIKRYKKFVELLSN